MPPPSPASIETSEEPSGRPVLRVAGHLDATSTGGIWEQAITHAERAAGDTLVVDAGSLDYCDGAGASLLMELERRVRKRGGQVEFRGLDPDTAQLIALIAPSQAADDAPAASRPGFVEEVGRASVEVWADVRRLVIFVGELTLELGRALRRPTTIRFSDAMLIAERAGIGAIPIIALVGFLLGLILAFQSVIPMQRFGAQIFVADFLGIAMARELSPLMAAILLTARSGSAFAAEIGTMKVNEEIDALTTMGLEPVRFLAVPRVLAAIAVVPTLTMLMTIAGLAGGAVVFSTLDFPLVTYVNRVVAATAVTDLLGGLGKSMVLGLIVAAVGCLRGLQTESGSGAVGESTTSSVVSGIILIAVAEGIFAVVFYVLGW